MIDSIYDELRANNTETGGRFTKEDLEELLAKAHAEQRASVKQLAEMPDYSNEATRATEK